MAWIEAHQSLPTHRKTLIVADELRISVPATVGHLVCLWTWALDNAPTGKLDGMRPRTVAVAAQWAKKPDDFVSALRLAGFIDPDGSLHNWDNYAGRLMYQRERNRKNVKAHRERLRSGDVSITTASTVPNPTRQELTQPDDPPSPRSAVVRAERARGGSRRLRDVAALEAERATMTPEQRYLGSRA